MAVPSEEECQAEARRFLERDRSLNPILTALREAMKDLRDDRDGWWPFKPPWMRPKKPNPKTPLGGEKKKALIKEKVDA